MYTSSIHWVYFTESLYISCIQIVYKLPQIFYKGSSNCDRKGMSYPVEYYLELVEEYSESKIHMSEPESGKGNVNTVYFVNQARGILESVARPSVVYNE